MTSPAAELTFAVIALHRRTESIIEVWLRPVSDALTYRAGQYVLLQDTACRVQPRSYSLANAPRSDGLVSLLVGNVVDGQASSWIHNALRIGDRVTLSGPYGTFTASAVSTAAWIFMAAGSCLAPLRAIAEDALVANRERALTLLLSARTESDVLDGARFAAWQDTYPRFRFIRTLTRGPGPPPLGRIPVILPRLYSDLAGYELFIAGSGGFVNACADGARMLGARPDAVHTEVFHVEP